MSNQELIHYLYNNYTKILSVFNRTTKCDFISEECIAKFCETLLTKEEQNVDYPGPFIERGLMNQFLNYNKYGRWFSYGTEECEIALEEAVHDQDSQLTKLIKARTNYERVKFLDDNLSKLPTKQKLAVDNFLKYGNNVTGAGNKNTQKAQFLNAVKTLKGLL